MQVLVGTSGYSYKEWKGSFYPEDLKPDQMLEYYSSKLKTVEINNTFYRMPKKELLQKWGSQVPDGFSFVLKASNRITHKKRLDDCADEVGYLTGNALELGDKLGPMLFQMPPWFKKDADRLKAFVEILPDGWKAAFEFRHESWFDDETYEILRSREVALAVSDTDKGDEPPVVATAPYGYLRLRRPAYDEQQLQAWAQRIREQPWETAHVFFKHEDGGTGPRLAAQFEKLF